MRVRKAGQWVRGCKCQLQVAYLVVVSFLLPVMLLVLLWCTCKMLRAFVGREVRT